MTDPCAAPLVVGEHPPLEPRECHPCRTKRVYNHYADSIPPKHCHCRDCHLTFRANNTIGHCAACHETFRGGGAFDSHQQTGTRGVLCLTAKEIAEQRIPQGLMEGEPAFLKDENGFWYLNKPYGGVK